MRRQRLVMHKHDPSKGARSAVEPPDAFRCYNPGRDIEKDLNGARAGARTSIA